MNQTDASVLGAAWFSHLPSLLMCVSGLKEAVGRIKKMEGHLELHRGEGEDRNRA